MNSLLVIALLFSAFVVCTLAQPSWSPVASQFSPYIRPFRYGHCAGLTTFGRMVSFSGITETSSGTVSTTRFNFLSNGKVQTLQPLTSLDRGSRVLTACGLVKDNFLTLYGGYRGDSNVPTPRLQIFDITLGNWVNNSESLVGIAGNGNVENHFRFGAFGTSMAVDDTNGFAYLFGGNSIIYVLNFITRINVATQQFFQIALDASSAQPLASRYGSAVAFAAQTAAGTGPTVWIFGGKGGLGFSGSQDPEIYNDIGRFELNSNKWVAFPGSGARPAPRAYMATALLKNNVDFIIFGGRNDKNPTISQQTVYNDVWKFDLSTGAFTALSPTGTAPEARDKTAAMHMAWEGEDSILYYGGSTLLGAAFDQFWKLQFTSTGTSPIPAPVDLDVDTDVTSEVQDDVIVTLPPAISSSSSEQPAATPPPIFSEDGASTALKSWLSFVM